MNKILTIALALALASTSAIAQAKSAADRITGGPVIESVSDHSAVVAWSTNAKSSSILDYGTDRNNLSQKAEAPWGGKPHRVFLKNLQPNTTYYFRVHSGEAQGTGTSVDSPIYELKTVPKGAAPNRQNVNVGVPTGK
ncbi:MAG: Fibronectin, type [Acidobacteriales bacterium]|nr:Fibronectin, type [Terriglobales bacterium]